MMVGSSSVSSAAAGEPLVSIPTASLPQGTESAPMSPRVQCIRAGESSSSLVHPRRRVLECIRAGESEARV